MKNAVRALLMATALSACHSEGAPALPDGGAAFSRLVGNCVMTPGLCPSHYCLPQREGTFRCACVDVPPGQTCEPCPTGYRYHSKYSTCEPTCALVGPTCPPGQSCGDHFGVATCMPSDAGSD
jgi:hypothetical protein